MVFILSNVSFMQLILTTNLVFSCITREDDFGNKRQIRLSLSLRNLKTYGKSHKILWQTLHEQGMEKSL